MEKTKGYECPACETIHHTYSSANACCEHLINEVECYECPKCHSCYTAKKNAINCCKGD